MHLDEILASAADVELRWARQRRAQMAGPAGRMIRLPAMAAAVGRLPWEAVGHLERCSRAGWVMVGRVGEYDYWAPSDWPDRLAAAEEAAKALVGVRPATPLRWRGQRYCDDGCSESIAEGLAREAEHAALIALMDATA